jgi:RNA polymerase sigma-70 factor (ECF subfamily)
MLLGFIQSRVNDKAIAEDILQEVFVKVYTRLETLKDTNKMQSWVFQITRNAIVDHYRSHKQTEQLPEEFDESELTFEEQDKKEMSKCFLTLTKNLPEKYREALIMSEIDGLKQKEVAEKQNISLSNAKIRIQRGRAKIKEMLMKGCKFEFDRQGRIAGLKEDENCKVC